MPEVRFCAYVCASQAEADRHAEFARAMRVKLLVPGQAMSGQRFDCITIGRAYLTRVDHAAGDEYRQLTGWFDAAVKTCLKSDGDLLLEPREPRAVLCA